MHGVGSVHRTEPGAAGSETEPDTPWAEPGALGPEAGLDTAEAEPGALVAEPGFDSPWAEPGELWAAPKFDTLRAGPTRQRAEPEKAACTPLIHFRFASTISQAKTVRILNAWAEPLHAAC